MNRNMLVGAGLAITLTLPMPGLAQTPRVLGAVSFISVDSTCTTNVDDCWLVEVDCPGLDRLQANLRFRYAQSTPKGAVVFTSGGPGTKFWGSGFPARSAQKTLAINGYTTVEIAWKGAWWNDSHASLDGSYDGFPTVACRPASVARYIHDTFVASDPNQAFCAVGTSGGSAQVAYMLTHYGLASILDLAMPVSGPPTTRNDIGCFQTPGYESMWYESGPASTVDKSFGIDARGPCVSRNISYETLYRDSSVSLGGEYFYPSTLVHFVFGGTDTSSAVAQGNHLFDTLAAAGTPLLGRETVPGAPHQVQDITEGATAIQNKILAECRNR